MLYNEHGWPGSGPGPVVSIGWMESVLRYTMAKMPKEKIVAAVSVFGFDFNVTTGRNQYVTYQMAVDRAQQYNSPIIFDPESQTPMFSYTDEAGNYHEVWFEDSRSPGQNPSGVNPGHQWCRLVATGHGGSSDLADYRR